MMKSENLTVGKRGETRNDKKKKITMATFIESPEKIASRKGDAIQIFSSYKTPGT